MVMGRPPKYKTAAIDIIEIIADADVRSGNAEKLKSFMPELIRKEMYICCAGIKRALDKMN